MSSREGAPSFEEDDDCTCCDTFCDFICGNDEEEDCACCLRCCSCIPGCEKGATPSCGIAGIDGWCVRRDFCGLICAGISVTVILMTHATVVTFIITPFFRWSTWGWIHLILFSSVVFLAFSSHLVCMTTSPGVMPRGVVSAEELAAQGDLPRTLPSPPTPSGPAPVVCVAACQDAWLLGRLRARSCQDLHQVHELQAQRCAPLQHLQPLRRTHGSPLPVGQQLCGPLQPEVSVLLPKLLPS